MQCNASAMQGDANAHAHIRYTTAKVTRQNNYVDIWMNMNSLASCCGCLAIVYGQQHADHQDAEQSAWWCYPTATALNLFVALMLKPGRFKRQLQAADKGGNSRVALHAKHEQCS